MIPRGRLWMGLMGAFLLSWGTWEFGELLGWLPEARFPWPLFVMLVGAAFLAGAITRQGGDGGWACGDEEPGDRRQASRARE